MYKSIVNVIMLIGLVAPAMANNPQDNVSKRLKVDDDVFNKMLDFKSTDDGISYEYVDFDEDEEEGELALQDDEDTSGLGRLMNT
ncbi:MAG: hypothetical protein COY39_05440 [Alphaproteobacteria bacterium CG_4_10_14_0_8_um_filter_37_21]|nr:MAG: hypothetical protein COY39_05440 [Alphaproteobacteria bacterium CG_4_10_14_0_8_um_filter_37_21]